MTDRTTDAESSGVGGMEATVRTFLLADFRGYTRFTRERGDEAASDLAARFADLVREVADGFAGELLELRGDEALCVFGSARQALRAAVEIQRRLRTPDGRGWVFPLGVGMGLDAGEAVPTEGGYRGAALNMAGRLVARAGPGEILATERLVGLASHVDGLRWGTPRALRLKGLDRPERVVVVETVDPIPPPPSQSRQPTRWRRVFVGAVIAAIAIAIISAALIERGGGDRGVRPIRTRQRSIAVIDSVNERVTADIRLSSEPESIAFGSGHLWVGGADQTVTPVAVTGRKTGTPIPVGIDPAYLAVGSGAVWAFDGKKTIREVDPIHLYTVGQPHPLWRCSIDPFTNRKLPGCEAGGLVVVGSELWVSSAVGSFSGLAYVDRFNATTLHKVGVIHHVEAGPLASGYGQVWSWGDVGQTLTQVGVTQHRVTGRTPLGVAASYTGGGIAVGFGAGWVAAPASGTLLGVEAGQTAITYRHRLVAGLTCVATTPKAVMVGVEDGRLLQVDPFSGHVDHTYRLHGKPVAMAYANNRLWIALA